VDSHVRSKPNLEELWDYTKPMLEKVRVLTQSGYGGIKSKNHRLRFRAYYLVQNFLTAKGRFDKDGNCTAKVLKDLKQRLR